MKLLHKYVANLLIEKKLRKNKDKRTLYHINKYRPARPQQKMKYMQDWDPGKIDPKDGERGAFVKVPGTNNWDRWWMDSPVESGVFLTSNPLDIAMNHGRIGHVYAYRVPEWVIDKSGGMHRYDHGSEVLIPEDVWNKAGKEIEFLGKSMSEDELWKKMDTSSEYGPGHHRKPVQPSWMTDEELKQWKKSQNKFNLSGLRATKHPAYVVKMLKPTEIEAALSAFEEQYPEQLAGKESKAIWVKDPNERRGGMVTGEESPISKKDQQLVDLLKKRLKESLLRETIRRFLSEGIEFRTLDSPLAYNRSGNVKRIAYCDSSVTEPPQHRDAYFKEWEKWRTRTKSGRKKLKKPVLEEIVPGVSDVCIIGFLDYHQYSTTSDGSKMWYIDYMKTRGDSTGRGVASKLMDRFYETIPQPGDHVHFGKMMREEIGHLKNKMKEKYPEINTIGAVYY